MAATFVSPAGLPTAPPVGAVRSLSHRLASASSSAALSRRSRGRREGRRCRLVMTAGQTEAARAAIGPEAVAPGRATDAAVAGGGVPPPITGAPRIGRRQALVTGLVAVAGAALAGSAPSSVAASAAPSISVVSASPVEEAAASAAAASVPHSLAVFSVNASPSSPYHATLERRSDESVMEELASSSVIFLGETHSSAADHLVQARVIDELVARSASPLVVALEMVERPFQPALDAYVAGNLSDEELFEATEWASRWGWPFENYLPMLHACRRHRVPLLAMSLPGDLVRRVRLGGGLEALTRPELQAVLPDPAGYAAYASVASYRQYVRDVVVPSFQEHVESGLLGDKPSFRGFWAAQSLWDESMAASIACAAVAPPNCGSLGGVELPTSALLAAPRARPTRVVAVLGGQHVRYGYGVPRRVERLVAHYQAAAGGAPPAALRTRSVVLNPSASWRLEMEGSGGVDGTSSGAAPRAAGQGAGGGEPARIADLIAFSVPNGPLGA
ncbi:hypothetical protein MMPV_008399 [Pyropia vietnamensis]